jgi:hypothetical protein
MAQALVRLLYIDDTFFATRPFGYANARVVDVEHPAGMLPDTLVIALDPLARIEGVYPDAPEPTP